MKKLLELNKYTVKVAAEGETETLKIGVTEMLFNLVDDVYKCSLIDPSGKKVTTAYWLQESVKETEAEVNYWNLKG